MITLFGVIVAVVAILALAEMLQTYLKDSGKRAAKMKKISERLRELERKDGEDKKD